MQRIDIPKVTYAGNEQLTGSLQLAAMPRHFVLSHRLVSPGGTDPVTLTMEISAIARRTFPSGSGSMRAFAHPTKAAGWAFILPELRGHSWKLSYRKTGTPFSIDGLLPRGGRATSPPRIGDSHDSGRQRPGSSLLVPGGLSGSSVRPALPRR